ncbi:MAG: hypothetical protein QXK37_04710 [Candidatus Woesearchaeota archaeon]
MRKIFYPVLALGFSAVITQIILFREFINIADGNEIIIGIIFADWLILTGAGAYLGRLTASCKKKILLLTVLQALIAVLPFCSLLAVRLLRNVIFLPGVEISFIGILLFSFCVLAPFCLSSGMALNLASQLSGGKNPIGKVYLLDNIGAVIGSAVFSFVLILFFNPFHVSYLLMFVNLIIVFILGSWLKSRLFVYGSIIMLVALFIFAIFTDINNYTIKRLYRTENLLAQKDTSYGNIVITLDYGQVSFFENSVILIGGEEEAEKIHYALLQTEQPKKILFIGGAVALNESLKYSSIQKVDYVEIDPLLVSMIRQYTSFLNNNKIFVINDDARTYLLKRAAGEGIQEDKYDAIIVLLPTPTNAQLNRYFTKEFFQIAKRSLSDDGVIMVSVESSENYQNIATKKLAASVYSAAASSFTNVLVIPGDSMHFVASNKNLTYDYLALLRKHNLSTRHFESVLPALTKGRIAEAEISVQYNAKTNKDFFPSAYFYGISIWLGKYRFGFFIFAFALFFAAYLFFTKPNGFVLFSVGFSASLLEVVIILGIQIVSGSAYSTLALIVMLFMLGLVFGSIKPRSILAVLFIMSAFSIFTPFALLFASKYGVLFIMHVLAFFLGYLTAQTFVSIAFTSLNEAPSVAHKTAQLYSADLFGASAGAIASVFLIPLIGIIWTSVVTGGLLLAALFVKAR